MRPVMLRVRAYGVAPNPIWWRRLVGPVPRLALSAGHRHNLYAVLDVLIERAVNLNTHEDHETHDT